MTLILSIILSLITIRGFRYIPSEDGLVSADVPMIGKILILLILLPILYRSGKDPDSRLKTHAGAFGIITAVCYTLGLSMDRAKTLSLMWQNSGYTVNFLNIFLSRAVLFYSLAYLIFSVLKKNPVRNNARPADTFFRKRVLLWCGLLLIAYIPWFLYFYPGILTQDSEDVIQQALAMRPLNNHHSVLTTLALRLVTLPVMRLTGSAQHGISTFLFLQMLLSAFIFALTFERIRGYVSSVFLRCIVFVFFAFHPLIQIYNVTLWKDVPFALCFLALMLCIDAIAEDEAAYFSSRHKRIGLFLTLLLLPILRHNGIAVTLFISVYMLIRIRPFRRQIALICGSALLLFAVWDRLLLPALRIETVESGLGLSVFQQQIARTLAGHQDEIPKPELEALTSYFDIPDIGTRYDPLISDSVKKHFMNEVYDSDPGGFFLAWAKLGIRYPLDYIEAFLHNNYGYWYPYPKDHLSYYGTYTIDSVEGLHPAPKLRSGIMDGIYNLYSAQSAEPTPAYLLFSPGLCFWLWLLSAIYCLYRNRRKLILFIPGLALWLTVLISPVFNEKRYVYGLFIAVPLVLASSLSPQQESK